MKILSKSIKKVIICIILAVLVLSGCNKKEPIHTDGAYYVDQLRNFKVKDKNINNTKNNEKFDQFLEWVFEEKVVSDFLDFHYNIYDYEKMGLKKPEAELGQYKYGLDEEQLAYYNDLLNDLRAFDYESLSHDQQFDYDCLEFDILCKLCDICFYKYKFYLKSGEGVPDTLPSYFTDYTFNNEEAVTDYLKCLADIPRAYDDILAYTKAQADDGYPLLDGWIDDYQDTCDSFINSGENNDLIKSFDRRIDECGFLSEESKASYKQENKKIVIEKLVPAYKKLKEEIEQYRGKANIDDYRYIEMDKDYADYIYMCKSSSTYTVDQMIQIISDVISTLQAEYMTAIYEEEPFMKTIRALEGEYEIFDMPLDKQLEHLYKHTNEYFPELEEVKYTVEYLDPDNTPTGVAAYYWLAPIDNDNQNIIRVNPNNKDDMTYRPYGTMAHEGFPGHLYQTIYFHRQNPSKFRYVTFSNLAYLEGWAEYSSYYGFRMADLNDDLAASVMFYDANYYFLENSLIDLFVNYCGYSAQDLYDYFSENSIFPYELSDYEHARDIMIQYSGQYIPYGFGMAYMFELRDVVAGEHGENFNIKEFHKAVLDSGIMPMNILKASVYEKMNITE